MKILSFGILLCLASLLSAAQEKKSIDTIKNKEVDVLLHRLIENQKITPVVKPGFLTFRQEKNNFLLIELGNKQTLSAVSSAIAYDSKNEENNSKGVIDKKNFQILFNVDKFSSLDTVVVSLTVNKKPQDVWILIRKTNNGAGIQNGESKPQEINYLALAKKLGYSLDLADLYPRPEACCEDSKNPCDKADAAVYYKNKIIYYANRNETVYYDQNGQQHIIDYQDISVRGGRPLSFEIRNINPDAFKIEITDTAIAYEYQIDTLLNFLPGVGPGFFQAEKVPKLTKIDTARAVLLIAYMNLKEFFIHLQNGCIYEFNENIRRKIEAKKRFDQYIGTHLNTAGQIGFAQVLLNVLDEQSEEDKELSEKLVALYNNLPASYYRLITQIPVVPKDKDKIEFTFSILSRENTPYTSPVRKKTINAYIIRNFRIDVSTGLYYAYDMQNEKYLLRADSIVGRNAANTADSTYKRGNRIVKENLGDGEFGFSSFIHFYKRLKPGFSWGGHIGAGLNFNEKTRPRYFGGLSFIFGRDNTRIAINIGVVAGNVEKISDQYSKETDGNFKWTPSGETAIITKNKFIARPFISISYNLPFRSKKKTTEVVTKDPPTADTKKDEGKK